MPQFPMSASTNMSHTMFNLFDFFTKNTPNISRVAGFRGGIHPEQAKRSAGNNTIACPLPPVLIHPMKQHIGQACEPMVSIGERVLRGQKIAKSQGYLSVPIHASTSGKVVKIEEHAIPHPSGMGLPSIFIEPDGLDEVDESLHPMPNYRSVSAVELRERIRYAGLAGMGGAVFPTFVKLVQDKQHRIETVILNGIECEPWLTCDHQLMLEKASEIITGMDIIMHMTDAEQGIIAIEDNKADAVVMMETSLRNMGLDKHIRVMTLPTKYPQGSEKQLIETLTGKEIPSGKLPIHVGVLSQNVGTSKAIYDAVCLGEPLTERTVTISGDALAQPANMRVRLGTTMRFALAQQGLSSMDGVRVIHGGPMMGELMRSVDIPILKGTNGILAMQHQSIMLAHDEEEPCIRCGDCGEACPAGLMPNLLANHCKQEQFERAEDYNLFDCIECGACSYVCPSRIPLVHYFRFGKGQIAQIRREKTFAEESRVRSDARESRILQEKAAKEEKRRLAKEKKEARAKALAETAKKEESEQQDKDKADLSQENKS